MKGCYLNMTVNQILQKHRISKRIINVGNISYTKYRIQFNYPKGKRNEITGDSESEIIDKLQKIVNSYSIGFRDLVDIILNDKGYINSSPKTYKHQIRKAAEMLYPYLDNQPVNLIDLVAIQKSIRKLSEKYSNETLVQTVRNLKNILNYAFIHDYIEENPISNFSLKRRFDEFNQYYLSEDEVVELIDSLNNHPFKNLYILCLTAGIPATKLIALSWRDIDFENKRIHINKKFKEQLSDEIVNLGKRDIYYSYQPEYVMHLLLNE